MRTVLAFLVVLLGCAAGDTSKPRVIAETPRVEYVPAVSYVYLLTSEGRVALSTTVRGRMTHIDSRHLWMTMDGTRIEWNGTYVLSERPVQIVEEDTVLAVLDSQVCLRSSLF